MKSWRWGCLGFAIAIAACGQGEAVQSPQPVAVPAAESCAPMESETALQPESETRLPFERFDFRPTQVAATDTTLTFTGEYYSFTLCKRDRTWGVQTLTPTPRTEADYADYYQALAEPDYEPVTGADTYQARVRLDAAWLDDESAPSDSLEQVIFEVIKPGESDPVSTVLYTNNDIIERELGASAGIPEVSRTLATDDALWWAIGFEQGEGASGIATVVQYQFDTDEIVLWQPTELENAQITDLALTEANDKLTLWLGTQYSGEGNPYLPAKGLVAYSPANDTTQTYTTENSPLVGAIPTRLWVEDSQLWVATANGVCDVEWSTIDQTDSWECWRFTAMAEVPAERALYASLLAETSIDTLETSGPVELLWLADTDISQPAAPLRYEISYEPGITTRLSQGAEYYVGPEDAPGYFWWPGQDWSWTGQRFVRYWDQVAVNYVGGGPQGIGPNSYEAYVADWQAMRGEFELLSLTPDTAEIRYYSAWIDAAGIEPWVTVTEATPPKLDAINPTEAVLEELKQAAR